MRLLLCLAVFSFHITLYQTVADVQLPSGISSRFMCSEIMNKAATVAYWISKRVVKWCNSTSNWSAEAGKFTFLDQYCEGCIATIKELTTKVQKRMRGSDSREAAVMDELEDICTAQNFVTYEYSPPRTVKACKLLVERHEEDIETAFAERKENLENLICYEISKACEGVDRTKKPKDYSGIDLTTNGEKQKVEKVVNVDPATGKTVVEDVDAETKESEGKPENSEKAESSQASEKKKLKKKESKKQSKETDKKTLSKKDKKAKKITKKEKKEKPKVTQDNPYGADNMFHIDVNDPGAMEKVMAQIKQATQEHTAEHYRKQEEKGNSAEKDEL